MTRKGLLVIIILVSIYTIFFVWHMASVKAEDNETDDDEYIQPVVIQPKTTTSVETTNPKSGTTVTTTTKVTTFTDSDGDGLLDTEDPHPQIPEFYIVTDDNRNGIVDQFEK